MASGFFDTATIKTEACDLDQEYKSPTDDSSDQEASDGDSSGRGEREENPFFGGDQDDDPRHKISTVQKCPSYLKLDGSTGLVPSTHPINMEVIKKLSFFDDTLTDLEEEKLKTYLRIRPSSASGREHHTAAGVKTRSFKNQKDKVLEVKDEMTVVAYPANKSLGIFNGNNKGERDKFKQTEFKFSRVLGPECGQSAVFDECIRPLIEKFLKNENCLIFTYGATNSGKTYTLQGHALDYGIIPRTLDTIFNRLQDRLYKNGNIKPYLYQAFHYLSPNDMEEGRLRKEKILADAAAIKSELLDRLRNDSCSESQSSHSGSSVNFVGSHFDEMSYALFTGAPAVFSIWVSFAELYNERVYDLLETVVCGKNKRRKELKLLQDRNGLVYIKDLTEIHVTSQDEAYKIFLAGRKNLQFAATQMNKKSSRSHSFFTLRVVTIEIGNGLEPFPKSVHRLTFCDLAGMERVYQTENEGARLKESGNINTSLTVLLKVIRILREKQIHKNRMIETIPFRESKLTHIFKSFFTSATHICMIVNVNPDPATANSTLQVLHNSAIASNVIVFRPVEAKPLQNSRKNYDDQENIMDPLNRKNKKVNFGESKDCLKVFDSSYISSSEERQQQKKLESFGSSSSSDSGSDDECPSVVARNRLLQQRCAELERENHALKKCLAQVELEKEHIREESAKLLADQNRLWSNRIREARLHHEYFNKRRISLMQNQLSSASAAANQKLSPGHKCGWNCTPPVVEMENIKEELDSETELEVDTDAYDAEISDDGNNNTDGDDNK